MIQRSVKPIPEGMHTVTPHLVCKGAREAIEFYRRAFGAEELRRLPGPEGRIMHAMIRIGDSPVMLIDEFPEWRSVGPRSLKGTPVTLHLYFADVDRAFERAVDAGAKVVMPPCDMFWGDRYGVLEDPFGHRWAVATHIQDLSTEEILAAAAKSSCLSSTAAAEPVP